MSYSPQFQKEIERLARVATAEATRELNATPRHMLDPGNPNHPDNFGYTLFGQNEVDFLKRQYH